MKSSFIASVFAGFIAGSMAQSSSDQTIIWVTETAYDCDCTSAAIVPTSTTTSHTLAIAQTTAVASAVPLLAATPAVVVQAVVTSSTSSSSGTKKTASTAATVAPSASACPATAHVDALASPNYPTVIVPVSSSSPNTVYGAQYFASIGNGNSTIFTFNFATSGTCTLEFKFPTKAYIKQLDGTTDYTYSSSNGAFEIYQLQTAVSPANPNISYTSKPARSGAAIDATFVEGGNTTISTFPCPAGESISYEMVAVGDTSLTFFEDYNPPPLGLLMLTC